MIAQALGSRAALAKKLVPRSSMRLWFSQSFGGVERRGDDGHITGAAAEMARQELAQLGLLHVRMMPQKIVERHQDSRGAKAALQRVVAPERLLQDGQTPRLGRQSLHGADAAAVYLHGKRQAGARHHTVDVDGASAADAML